MEIDPSALKNILRILNFYLSNSNYAEQQGTKCPNFGPEEDAKFKGSSNWFQRFKRRNRIVLRRRTNKKKVYADDGRETIQNSTGI